MSAITKPQLKKILEEIKGIRSRHTELLTVYVPADFNINIVRNQLSQELGTASNIKSKTTRKNVEAALDKALSEIKYYPLTPPNGLVILTGNVSSNPAVDDLRAWSFEPPEKVTVRMYRTEPEFIVEPLNDMIEPKNVYGLIIMDDKEVTFGLLKGKAIKLLKEAESMVPGKMHVGGQSSRRFQRVREEIVKHWHKMVADWARELFSQQKNLKGILIGGSGQAKEVLADSGELNPINTKVLSIQDIGHTGIVALRELVDKSESALQKEELMSEKKEVNEFLTHLGKDNGLAVYGIKEVTDCLNRGMVNKLLISESLTSQEIEDLTKIAESFRTETIIVSTESPEGEQLKNLGGVGAILRYKQ